MSTNNASTTNNANSQFWQPQVPNMDISPRNNNPFNGLIDMNANAMSTNNASNIIKISRSMLKNTSVCGGKREDSPKNNLDPQRLNAKAMPFSMNGLAPQQLSPQIKFAPHPQTFAFPPHPIPTQQNVHLMHANIGTPIRSQQQQQQQQAMNMNAMMHPQQSFNLNSFQQVSPMNANHHSPMNVPLVQRGSPLFAPTHSPQFQPFSH